MLPLNIRDLVARAGIVLRNEDLRPWLPLDHHGQGLQSLSVIFLFQAVVMQKLSEEIEGAEAVFAIEEPEVHLHPQAARTLWTRIAALPGQKLVTTHSPYFVQNVPLHNLRITRFHNGSTEIAFLPRRIISVVPWTDDVKNFIEGRRLTQFTKDELTGCIVSTLWFDEAIAKDLVGCLRKTAGIASIQEKMDSFRHTCRVLISDTEEAELSFLGRRIRGEIFFAREWILVEGVSEFLLSQAIGRAFGYDLDQHGISVIDFQNNGNAGIYSALADGFGIPWQMATDGDAESEKFHAQLFKRGYVPDDFKNRVFTLSKGNDLEDQLLADGHETLLREVLGEVGMGKAAKCSVEELKSYLKNRKTAYMANLAPKVAANTKLAAKMPKPFVAMVKTLKDKYDGHHV
jgi:putative ATP-dependent endonuclease of OLD family